ncbi:MAG: isoprenyl transferase [Hyphomicrobiales bacterium]|nr:isoprenyl transferase [Hyphomicrobiales bacterium]
MNDMPSVPAIVPNATLAGLSVGIIMDGNGRWAQARGLPRLEGHRRGMEALRGCVRSAPGLGVRYLTLYSFSVENWSRPPDEVEDLMGLLRLYLRRDLAELNRNGVRVRIIGERKGLPPGIAGLLDEAEATTARNSKLDLVLAFNYGGRQEITRAMRRLADKVKAGTLAPQAISLEDIDGALDTAGVPDPEVIIRTSGEQRLSNFLLWQAAYAEFVFLPALWPDFDEAMFAAALDEFRLRTRRFGGRNECAPSARVVRS